MFFIDEEKRFQKGVILWNNPSAKLLNNGLLTHKGRTYQIEHGCPFQKRKAHVLATQNISHTQHSQAQKIYGKLPRRYWYLTQFSWNKIYEKNVEVEKDCLNCGIVAWTQTRKTDFGEGIVSKAYILRWDYGL